LSIDSEAVRSRVIGTRLVLGAGAIIQLLLISALPFDGRTSEEWYSFSVLLAMVASSIAIATALTRFPRASLGLLAVVSLLSVWQLLRFSHMALGFIQRASFGSSQSASFLVASLAYYSFLTALVIAWPTRKGA